MKWIDYREKLGIGFDDSGKFKILSTVLQNYIEQTIRDSYSEQSYLNYCQMIGEPYCDNYYPYHLVKRSFKECCSTTELISKYIAFCNTFEPSYDRYSYQQISRESVFNYLKSKLDDINLCYDILKDKDGAFIFPKGVKEFDDALVSEPLSWLSQYPQTEKEWLRALKAYSELSDENASDVADKFRKSLERFFQEFFNKTQSLENLKSEYGKYLKNKGIPAEISNNLETIQQSYMCWNI